MSAVIVFRTFVAASLCTALAACTMGPDFVRPQAELPSHWQGEAVAGNAIDQDAAWWAGFDDPLLGQLANQCWRPTWTCSWPPTACSRAVPHAASPPPIACPASARAPVACVHATARWA